MAVSFASACCIHVRGEVRVLILMRWQLYRPPARCDEMISSGVHNVWKPLFSTPFRMAPLAFSEKSAQIRNSVRNITGVC